MKKLLVLGMCLWLGACASISNPITGNALTNVESAYGVALSAAVAYKQLCVQRTIPSSCRTVVVQMQQAGIKVQGAIIAARNFVKNNPTLDPASAIAAAQVALSDFQTVQTANGVH